MLSVRDGFSHSSSSSPAKPDDNEEIVHCESPGLHGSGSGDVDSPASRTRAKTADKRASAPAGKSTSSKKKKAATKTVAKSSSEKADFLEVFLANAEADRKAERDKERRQARRERKERKENVDMFMSAMQSMTACVVAAITKEAPVTATPQEITGGADSSDSSDSSVQSEAESDSTASSVLKKKSTKKRKTSV